ncbi:hypothetical protein [Streptomyces qinzhouensis]|uniref:Integral membrane protein n=1 Tax=Streptomyces qinzhouensis TaxID=2599401 RepID=A0A5B8J8U4_9ACTN|nr:hypothetical protein [Streptomyces qinzhouensis]QDY77767.1 hypothetical protein FQU76_16070 [Streptomyces qinzhouensis]
MSSLSPRSGAPTGAGLRLLRAAVFTAVCVVLSATGHALAACAGVPWWTLAAGFAGTFALVLPFTGRVRSLPSVVVALGAGQLALHALFGLGQRHPDRLGPTADDALIRMAANLLCGPDSATLSPDDARRVVTLAGLTPPDQDGHPGHEAARQTLGSADLLPSLPMLLAHLLVAVVTGWLLRRGDLALLRLTRLSTDSAYEARELMTEAARLRSLRAALVLVRTLRAGLVCLPDPGVRPVRPGDDPAPPAAEEALQHTVIRRGPPARLALAA